MIKRISFGPINSINEDALDYKKMIEPLADTILALNRGSVVALYGDWGSGKTSFLLMLMELFKNKNNVNTAWVPLWEYEKTPNLTYKLAQDISKDDDKWEKLIRYFLAIGEKSLVSISFLLRSLKINIPGELAEFQLDIDTEIYARETKRIDKKRLLYKDAEEALIGALTKVLKKKKETIIFIDDIDRCEPNNAISLLENLKLVLHKLPCLFILGVNRGVIQSAVKARYKSYEFDDPEHYSLWFLDKLIDFSENLLDLEIETADKYIGHLLASFDPIVELTSAERYIILSGVPYNPRAIKRLIVHISYHRTLATYNNESQSMKMRLSFLKTQVLKMFYPKVFVAQNNHIDDFRHFTVPINTDNEHGSIIYESQPKEFFEAIMKLRNSGYTAQEVASQDITILINWINQHAPHLFGFLRIQI